MNGKSSRVPALSPPNAAAEVKEILVRGKRLRAGDSWSKLYAERAFKNQRVTSPKELKHHESIVKQYGRAFPRPPRRLSPRAGICTCCRPRARRTASRMWSMTRRCPPTTSRGPRRTRYAPRTLPPRSPHPRRQLDPDNSIVGMLPERLALKGLVRAPRCNSPLAPSAARSAAHLPLARLLRI